MLRTLMNGLLDLIYPRKCLSCKARLGEVSVDGLVCVKCYSSIKRNLPPFCHICGRHLSNGNSWKLCPECSRLRLHFDRAFSPCVYEGVLKELIHEFKYKGKDYLAATLSRLMNEFIREYKLPLDYLDFIVPLPLHNARLREREFNQAELLSRHIAGEFKKDILPDLLVKRRNTRTQTELETHERLLNVKDSFAINQKRDIKGKGVLLVDDVLTTGATSSEAARVLKEAGANMVFVLTLAN